MFNSQNELEEHEVEHRTSPGKINVPEQQTRVVCDCVFPCVPSKVVNALIIGPTLPGVETSGETPRRLDDPVQETLEHQEGEASSERQTSTHGWRRQGSRFCCNTCRCTRNFQNQIESHIRDRHWEVEEDGNYCCRYCPFQTNSSDRLIEHIEIAHGSKFNCDRCSFKSNQKNDLDKHIIDNHESTKQCEVCNISFRNNEELSQHINNTHKSNEESLVTCKRCGIGLYNKNDLLKHLATTHKSYKPCIKLY